MKRLICIILAATICMSITGCSVVRKDLLNEDITSKTATCNSKELYDGQFYVWHDEQQSNIEKDINCDQSKFKDYNYNIFRPVYMDENKLEDEEVIMVLDENDEKIPTLHPGDKLVYYSTSKIPLTLNFAKYYDHGYSIGLYHLTEVMKYSEQYIISDASYVKKGSSVERIGSLFSDCDKVSIAKVGDVNLTYENLSEAGTIKGLIEGNSYEVNAYAGTLRYTLNAAAADTRIFSKMGDYEAYSYSFVGNGVMIIDIPSYFKSGYYTINKMGLFKYVANESDTNFNEDIDKDEYNKYEEDLIVKKETEKITNSDWINEDGISSMDVRAVTVDQHEALSISLSTDNIINDSIKSSPQIAVYNSSLDDNAAGGYNNPKIVTFENLKANKKVSEYFDLGKGVYVVTLTGMSNYVKYNLDLNIAESEKTSNSDSTLE